MRAPLIPPSQLTSSTLARAGAALLADTADARLNPAGKLVVRQKPLLRSSAIRAISAYLEDRTGVAGYEGRSWDMKIDLDALITGVQFIIPNMAGSYTLDKALYYSTGSVSSSVKTGAGAAEAFITKDGVSGPFTIPAGYSKNAANWHPRYWKSDIMPFTPIARTDGLSAACVLGFRAYCAGTPQSLYLNASHFGNGSGLMRWDYAGVGTVNRGRVINIKSKPGDFVSSNSDGFTSPAPDYGGIPVMFKLYFDRKTLSVGGLGDSLMGGGAEDQKGVSPLHFAVSNVSTLAQPVIFANFGFDSAVTNNHVQRLLDLEADDLLPDVLFYNAFSPNNVSGGVSQAALEVMWNHALEVAEICRRNSKILALGGAISAPVTAASTADEDRVLAFNERLRALEASHGIYYVDRWAAVANTGRPANIKNPDYASGANQLHWITAGAAREGDYAFTPVLQRIADAWFAG